MKNPYTPPSAAGAESSGREWVRIGSAILAGLLSLMMLFAIISNCIIFVRLSNWPTAIWQWVGLFVMTTMMLMTFIAFAHISIGLIRSNKHTWKRGLWILLVCVLGYAAIVVVAGTMRALA